MDGESWLTNELASFACAACGQPYGEERVRLIAQRDELFFVDLACAHCGSQAVAIVSIQVEEPSDGESAGLVLEADVQVDVRAPHRAVVSPDDVLDVHKVLADHEGDIRSLLARLDGKAA